jgi:hypothetical protein
MGLFQFLQNNPNTTDRLPTSDAVNQGAGPLSSLDLNPYSLNVLKYPQEVGLPEAPHYVRFDINLPNNSKYFTNGTSSLANVQSAAEINADLYAKNGGAINMSAGDIGSAAAVGGAISAIKSLTQGFGAALGNFIGTGAQVGVAGVVTKNTDISIKPKTTRTSTSISLYMPDTVVTSYDHDWNALSLTDALGKLQMYTAFGADLNVKGIAAGVVNDGKHLNWHIPATKQALNNAKIPTELKGQIAQATGQVGSDFTTFALKNQGLAVNPHLEMVFRGTDTRKYIFEFDFQPRSQKEALNIRKILQTFRAYAAPEIANGSGGRYFIPPAQFDISYRFQNVENNYIARISTCALTNIAINWNQAGAWSSFVDGAPLHIHVALTFQEMDVITREMIQGLGY